MPFFVQNCLQISQDNREFPEWPRGRLKIVQFEPLTAREPSAGPNQNRYPLCESAGFPTRFHESRQGTVVPGAKRTATAFYRGECPCFSIGTLDLFMKLGLIRSCFYDDQKNVTIVNSQDTISWKFDGTTATFLWWPICIFLYAVYRRPLSDDFVEWPIWRP